VFAVQKNAIKIYKTNKLMERNFCFQRCFHSCHSYWNVCIKSKTIHFEFDNHSAVNENNMIGSFLTIVSILNFVILKHPGIGNFKSSVTLGVAAIFSGSYSVVLVVKNALLFQLELLK